jgi:hypothetical protein
MTIGQEKATKIENLLDQLSIELEYYDDDEIDDLFEMFAVRLYYLTAKAEIERRMDMAEMQRHQGET